MAFFNQVRAEVVEEVVEGILGDIFDLTGEVRQGVDLVQKLSEVAQGSKLAIEAGARSTAGLKIGSILEEILS